MPLATVAVVDDDEAVRDSLRLLLEAHGFEVALFQSAAELLAYESLDQLGCALIDLHMPLVSGLDLLRRLRQRLPGLAVALMTGSPAPGIERQAAELGAVAVLNKPLAVEAMLGFVGRAVAGTT